jgi:hypothetical protein
MEEMKKKKASFLLRVAPRPNNALTVAAYSGQKLISSCSFLIRVAPGPNNALTIAAYSGQNDMQTQGPKTIGHMNSYISMLDFTSVPAWFILYC